MKKILTLLMGLSLTTTAVNTIISCKTSTNYPDDSENGFKDIEILDSISKRVTDAFLMFSQNDSMFDTNDYPKVDFDKLYGLVNATEKSVILDKNNPDVVPCLNILDNRFQGTVNNINNAIIHDYSNYYVDLKPLTLLGNSSYTLNYIDLATLGKIDNVTIEGLKAGRIDFKFRFQVQFKTYMMISDYVIQYTISNDVAKIKILQNGIITKLSAVVLNFFNNEGKIILDKNPNFKPIYDNFNINYIKHHNDLDNIIQQQLTTLITNDSDLANIKDYIVWNDDQELLLLQTSALNDKTSGISVMARPNNTAYAWAGEGPFDANKVTADTFYQFLINFINVFKFSNDNLELASFTVNL